MNKLVALMCALSCLLGFEAYGMTMKEKSIINVQAPKGFPTHITLVPIDDPLGSVFGAASFEESFTSRAIKTKQTGTHTLTKPFTLPDAPDVALLVFVNGETSTIFNAEQLKNLTDSKYTITIDSNGKASLVKAG